MPHALLSRNVSNVEFMDISFLSATAIFPHTPIKSNIAMTQDMTGHGHTNLHLTHQITT